MKMVGQLSVLHLTLVMFYTCSVS